MQDDYELGRGHGMAQVRVIQKDPLISAKFVGDDGAHRDESGELWFDGAATKPKA
ncbi:hypothetical protein BH10ACT6_BH10ACT6_06400 [soil metagenome]